MAHPRFRHFYKASLAIPPFESIETVKFGTVLRVRGNARASRVLRYVGQGFVRLWLRIAMVYRGITVSID
jgi:hypothetical protein